MIARPEYYASYKQKKLGITETILGMLWNHPHRLEQISISGIISYSYDTRPYGTYDAVFDEFSLDFSLLSDWNRKFKPNTPWDRPNDLEDLGLGDYEFSMMHAPGRPWEVIYNDAFTPPPVLIGTVTRKTFYRFVLGNPWIELSSTTDDITYRFDVTLTGGGLPSSGGKGTGADAEKVSIQVEFLNPAPLGFNGEWAPCLRLPWENTWASETQVFTDAFDAYMAQRMADYAVGDHTGSCTAELTFT